MQLSIGLALVLGLLVNFGQSHAKLHRYERRSRSNDHQTRRFSFDVRRVKLHHFESAHDQLFGVGSHALNAFERKYGLVGPIPEGLNNYMDVRFCSIVHRDEDVFLGSILR